MVVAEKRRSSEVVVALEAEGCIAIAQNEVRLFCLSLKGSE